MSFERQLAKGMLGEDEISQWLIRRGYSILPAYQIIQDHGKGPRLFTPAGKLVSPDLLAFNGEKTIWIEAKTKSAFSWHRITQKWTTGIDRRHWLDYVEVDATSPFRVAIAFLHREGSLAKDTPDGMRSPYGLYAGLVSKLKTCINHQSESYGTSGMVYWAEESLSLIAKSLELATNS
jgi:hypothetical protein